jgi:hypothetical protein
MCHDMQWDKHSQLSMEDKDTVIHMPLGVRHVISCCRYQSYTVLWDLACCRELMKQNNFIFC